MLSHLDYLIVRRPADRGNQGALPLFEDDGRTVFPEFDLGMLTSSTVQPRVLGRWVVIRGTAWIEPYAVELADEAGNTELRGYDLHIFPSDDDPQSGGETSFTDEDNEQMMSVLMGITEKIVRFDQVAKRETRPKAWPTALFWFSHDQKACFAYEAVGQLAFAKTPYARLAVRIGGLRATLRAPSKGRCPKRLCCISLNGFHRGGASQGTAKTR